MKAVVPHVHNSISCCAYMPHFIAKNKDEQIKTTNQNVQTEQTQSANMFTLLHLERSIFSLYRTLKEEGPPC